MITFPHSEGPRERGSVRESDHCIVDVSRHEGRTQPGLFARGVRLIRSYIRAHPKPFWLAVAGAFAFAIASVAVSVALGRVTDRVLRPAFGSGVDAATMWLGVAAILGLATLRAVSIMVRRYYSGVAGA